MAKENSNGANLGFESELWHAADTLRSDLDAAEYKPDKQARATELVLEQAEVLCKDWTEKE